MTPLAGGGGGGTPPTITEISPAFGLAGTIVTITGTDFTGATAVRFNGVAAASFAVNSATSITATAPTGVTTGPISVTTSGGTAASSNNFTVPVLSITAPTSINEGDSGQIATVTATPAPTSDLTITLASSSATDLKVDGGGGAGATSTATIFANATEASFFINAPADNTVDADANVTLTATAGGYNSGTAAVTVRNVDIAPISITATGTAYAQNFDSLGTNNVASAFSSTSKVQTALGSVVNSSLTGWFGTKLSGSATAATALTADYGNANSGGLYSYGATNAPANADRALGALASGSNIMGFGAVFKNNTGASIESFTVSFSAENWRGGTAPSKLVFGYGKLGGDVTGANFLSATGSGVTALASGDITGSNSNNNFLDGNSIKNSVNVTLPISVAAGESLFLRWQDADESGSDAALAIDDFSLTANATVIITPPSLTGVTVDEPSLTPTQATVSSQVVTDGGTNVTGQGFVFTPTATSADPTLSTAGAVSVTNTPAVGGFTNNLTNLTAGTAYTVKSYAINSVGTNYSSPTAFTTLAAYPTFTGVYSQNFANVTNNALMPAGWRSLSSSNINSFVGNWTNTNASTGGLYGRDGAPGILGYLHTSSTGILTNRLTLVNATGGTLTNLYVSYTGEVNLTNNGRTPAFAVAVNGTDVPELAYSTSGGTNSSVSALVANLAIGTNDQVTITWVSDRGTGSGSSRMIGLTDVRVATTPANVATPPTITSTNAFAGTVGVAFSNNIIATGTAPIAFSGTGLPGGLSVASGGAITGTPSAAGTFNATLTATNAAGTNNQAVTFTIAKGTPTITAAPTASALTAGQALSASLLTGGSVSVPGTFDWTSPSTVPGSTGSYGVTFTPTDAANYNTATTTVSVTVNPAGTTYSGWLNGASASDAAFLDYVFGAVTPGTLDPSLKPTVAVTAGNLVLTYYVRQGTVGLTVTPKTSTDLASGPSGWVTTDVTFADVGAPRSVNGVSVQQKTASVPVSGPKKFLRVEAVQQ